MTHVPESKHQDPWGSINLEPLENSSRSNSNKILPLLQAITTKFPPVSCQELVRVFHGSLTLPAAEAEDGICPTLQTNFLSC